MKKLKSISAIILLAVMAGCGGSKQSENQSDDLITVDVTAKYPKKELILQDFMDVEYIPLETNDEFICQGIVLDVGKEIILVRNEAMDGDIFIFDRNGKGLKKINRKGNSGEEYIYNYSVFLDEDNGEIFVNDNSKKKILVYDLYGNFKRDIRHKENADYSAVYNYDRECFIWWNSAFEFNADAIDMPSFFITSKHDGSIIREIKIPFEQRKSTVLMQKNEETGMTYSVTPGHNSIIPYFDNWILVEPSSDTIYRYSPDHSMKPFLVRIPSVQSMDPEVFLFPEILTDRYYFMQTVKKVYDFATQEGLPGTSLVYDKQEKTIFEYTMYNDDYSNKKRTGMGGRIINNEIALWRRINADTLLESYEKGELKGKLKEIAAELDEESNPVIMLIKHKK